MFVAVLVTSALKGNSSVSLNRYIFYFLYGNVDYFSHSYLYTLHMYILLIIQSGLNFLLFLPHSCIYKDRQIFRSVQPGLNKIIIRQKYICLEHFYLLLYLIAIISFNHHLHCCVCLYIRNHVNSWYSLTFAYLLGRSIQIIVYTY